MSQNSSNNYNPSELPFLIRKYLYPEFCKQGVEYVPFQRFCDILDGNDTGDVAKKILERLERKNSYMNRKDPWYIIPPKTFDILSDEISGTESIYATQLAEHHIGCCLFEGQRFSFEYDIIRSKIEEFKNDAKLEKATVICEGHSFERESSYIHMACQEYFAAESSFLDEKKRKKEFEERENRWLAFRTEHAQELIDWFLPIIGNSKSHVCNRVRVSVKGGSLSYSLAEQLDRGECLGCTGHCRFRDDVLPYGTHTQRWIDMGIDEAVLQKS